MISWLPFRLNRNHSARPLEASTRSYFHLPIAIFSCMTCALSIHHLLKYEYRQENFIGL
jgi:hypothetical protein